MPLVNRRYRLLARFNAIEPVPMLIIDLVEMNFIRADNRLQDPGITCIQCFGASFLCNRVARRGCIGSACDKYPSFGSFVPDAIWITSAGQHGNTIFVFSLCEEISVNIPE